MASALRSPPYPSPNAAERRAMDARFRDALDSLTASSASTKSSPRSPFAAASPSLRGDPTRRFDWLLKLDGVAKTGGAPQVRSPGGDARSPIAELLDSIAPRLQSPSMLSPGAYAQRRLQLTPSELPMPPSRSAAPFARDRTLGQVAILEARLAEQARAHGAEVRMLREQHAVEQHAAAKRAQNALDEVLIRAHHEFVGERHGAGARALAAIALRPLHAAFRSWRDRRGSDAARRRVSTAERATVEAPTSGRSLSHGAAGDAVRVDAAADAQGGDGAGALAHSAALHHARTIERLDAALRTALARWRQLRLGRSWRVWRRGAAIDATSAALRASFERAAADLKEECERRIDAHARDAAARIVALERAHAAEIESGAARSEADDSDAAARDAAERAVERREALASIVAKRRRPRLAPAFATWKLSSSPQRIPAHWLRWLRSGVSGSPAAVYAAERIVIFERETSDVRHWVRSAARMLARPEALAEADAAADAARAAAQPTTYRVEVRNDGPEESRALGASIRSVLHFFCLHV